MADYLSIKDTAKTLDLTSNWVYLALRRGSFPGAKKIPGFGWLIPRRSVEAYPETHGGRHFGREAGYSILPIRIMPDERERLLEIGTAKARALLSCGEPGASTRRIAKDLDLVFQTVTRWAVAWSKGDRAILIP